MPAILTHDFFGKDAFGPASAVVALYTPDDRDAFLLGTQGPDPLFYLMLTPPLKEFEDLGSTLHREEPSQLLVRLRRAVDALPEGEQGIGQAYVAGFVCHYLLDRSVHPLVYFWERGICEAGVDGLDDTDHSVVHAEVERDLDEMVLYAKRNQTVAVYKPYEEVLKGSDRMLNVVGELYYRAAIESADHDEPSLARVFPLAVRCFRVAQNLFWLARGHSRRALSKVEKRLRHVRYSLVAAMAHRVREQDTSDFDNREHRAWTNPFTGEESYASFWDLYNAALGQAVPAISAVLGEGFDEEAARALTGGLNFSGEPVA